MAAAHIYKCVHAYVHTRAQQYNIQTCRPYTFSPPVLMGLPAAPARSLFANTKEMSLYTRQARLHKRTQNRATSAAYSNEIRLYSFRFRGSQKRLPWTHNITRI